jgi:hypothetical protein
MGAPAHRNAEAPRRPMILRLPGLTGLSYG